MHNNNINWNEFIKAYKNSLPNRKKIFDSKNSPLCIKKIAKINNLDNSHYPKMLNIYGLYILSTKNDQEVIYDLRNMAIPKSDHVHKQIITCLNIKNSNNNELDKDIKETELIMDKITENNKLQDISKKENVRWETDI